MFESNNPVYWLGGSFSGGKTTTCRLLAKRFDLQPYHYDHDLLNSSEFSTSKIRDVDWFWLPVEQKVERYRNAFTLASHRIRGMAETAPVIAEGPGLLPELLTALHVERASALFLLPTPIHQRQANRQRGTWVTDVLSQVKDPELAWGRWMDLDEQFANYLSESAVDASYTVLWNDGTKDPADIMRQAADHFRLL